MFGHPVSSTFSRLLPRITWATRSACRWVFRPSGHLQHPSPISNTRLCGLAWSSRATTISIQDNPGNIYNFFEADVPLNCLDSMPDHAVTPTRVRCTRRSTFDLLLICLERHRDVFAIKSGRPASVPCAATSTDDLAGSTAGGTILVVLSFAMKMFNTSPVSANPMNACLACSSKSKFFLRQSPSVRILFASGSTAVSTAPVRQLTLSCSYTIFLAFGAPSSHSASIN